MVGTEHFDVHFEVEELAFGSRVGRKWSQGAHTRENVGACESIKEIIDIIIYFF
jgi:hypothetical protein